MTVVPENELLAPSHPDYAVNGSPWASRSAGLSETVSR